ENNGGFASVRGYLPEGIPTDAEVIELRVRGDGRTYQVRLRMGERFDGIAYRAEFDTAPDAWTVVRLTLTGFEPTFRGFRPRNAAPLNLTDVRQLGLMIADKKAGPFRLDVEWIRAVE
ncbi:MAG: CIA30 family protein, partial [marine benthic group bacterium]|nr:CIA30 family protein [Gemmatimonadota bacterium]